MEPIVDQYAVLLPLHCLDIIITLTLSGYDNVESKVEHKIILSGQHLDGQMVSTPDMRSRVRIPLEAEFSS